MTIFKKITLSYKLQYEWEPNGTGACRYYVTANMGILLFGLKLPTHEEVVEGPFQVKAEARKRLKELRSKL